MLKLYSRAYVGETEVVFLANLEVCYTLSKHALAKSIEAVSFNCFLWV